MIGISSVISRSSSSLTEGVKSGVKKGMICSKILVPSSAYFVIMFNSKFMLYGIAANCELRVLFVPDTGVLFLTSEDSLREGSYVIFTRVNDIRGNVIAGAVRFGSCSNLERNF